MGSKEIVRARRGITSSRLVRAVSAGTVVFGLATTTSAFAASGVGPGITKPITLAPYKPSNTVGAKPNLPKVIGYVQDSARGFEQLLLAGLQAGAKARGLKVVNVNSNGDAQQQVQDMKQFLVTGVAAMVSTPVDPTAQAQVQVAGINAGADMNGVVYSPATTELDQNQYSGGYKLAELAVNYIKTHLGGDANVVILNQDNTPTIVPRFNGILAALKTVPGIKVIANVQPATTDNQGGFNTMNTILQEGKTVNVVLGADAVVEGAYQALQADHKLSSKQFLAGVDCEDLALSYIEKNTVYKACVGLSPGLVGYAQAQFAADWLEGKNIPQGIDNAPFAVTSPAAARAYATVDNNPASVWNTPKESDYLQFYGNISYATRGDYIAFNWIPAP